MPRLIKKGWNFAQVPIWVLCDTRLDDGAKVLFAYLAWRQGESGGSWPSVPRMAADLGVSEVTIQRRLRALEEYGYLETEQRSGRSSYYTLNAGDEQAQSYAPGKNDTSEPKAELDPPQKCDPTPLKNVTPPPSKMIPRTIKKNDRKERDGLPENEEGRKSDSAPPSGGVSLIPESDEERLLFRMLAINSGGKRPGAARFKNAQQASDYRAAVQVLNGTTKQVLEAFFRSGGSGLGHAVSYVCGAARKRQAAVPPAPEPQYIFAPTTWEEP
jgi:biotin operon repressor